MPTRRDETSESGPVGGGDVTSDIIPHPHPHLPSSFDIHSHPSSPFSHRKLDRSILSVPSFCSKSLLSSYHEALHNVSTSIRFAAEMSEAVQAGPSTPSSTPHAPPGPSSPSTIRTRRASIQIPTTPQQTAAPASPTLRTSPRRAGKQREVEVDVNGNGTGDASSSPRRTPRSGRAGADIHGEGGEGSASMPAPAPVTMEEEGPQFIQPDHLWVVGCA